MNMARASEEDIKAALLLNGILEDVDGGKCPRRVDGEDDEGEPENFDKDNPDHLRMFYDRVMHCVRVRPSGIARVIWGFATIADNNVLDPDSKHLELHPRLKTEDLLKASREAVTAIQKLRESFGCAGYAPVALERLYAAVVPLSSAISRMETVAESKKESEPQPMPEPVTAPHSCPALTYQSKHYPKHWEGNVPTRVRMAMTVRPDPLVLAINPEKENKVCEEGREYEVTVNSHGAVSAIFPNGSTLGLKPNEFEVIAWACPEGVKRDA